jgi:hypothetical protein
VAVLDLGDHEELAEFALDYGTIYFQYFDANVSGDFGPGDPWVLSIEEGTGALESVVVDMGGHVFAGDFVTYWEQALDVSPEDEKWNETDYSATAEGISSLYEDYPFLQDWALKKKTPGTTDSWNKLGETSDVGKHLYGNTVGNTVLMVIKL